VSYHIIVQHLQHAIVCRKSWSIFVNHWIEKNLFMDVFLKRWAPWMLLLYCEMSSIQLTRGRLWKMFWSHLYSVKKMLHTLTAMARHWVMPGQLTPTIASLDRCWRAYLFYYVPVKYMVNGFIDVARGVCYDNSSFTCSVPVCLPRKKQLPTCT